MKTIAIRNNLDKVLPYLLKKLGEIIYDAEYDKDTQVLTTDIFGNKTKFSAKYNSEYYCNCLIINNEQIDCIFNLCDEDSPVKLIISNIGDIYFDLSYTNNIRVYVNKYTSHFSGEEMKNLFEVCELFGDGINPLNTHEDIIKILETKSNESN